MIKIESVATFDESEKMNPPLLFFYDSILNSYIVLQKDGNLWLMKMNGVDKRLEMMRRNLKVSLEGQAENESILISKARVNLEGRLIVIVVNNKLYTEALSQIVNNASKAVQFQIVGAPVLWAPIVDVKFHPTEPNYLAVLTQDDEFIIFDLNSNVDEPLLKIVLRNNIASSFVTFSFCAPNNSHSIRIEHLSVFLLSSDGEIYVNYPVISPGQRVSEQSLAELHALADRKSEISFELSRSFENFIEQLEKFNASFDKNGEDSTYSFVNWDVPQKLRLVCRLQNFKYDPDVELFDVIHKEGLGCFVVCVACDEKTATFSISVIEGEIFPTYQHKNNLVTLKTISVDLEEPDEVLFRPGKDALCLSKRDEVMLFSYQFLRFLNTKTKDKESLIGELNWNLSNCLGVLRQQSDFEVIDSMVSCCTHEIRLLGYNPFWKKGYLASAVKGIPDRSLPKKKVEPEPAEHIPKDSNAKLPSLGPFYKSINNVLAAQIKDLEAQVQSLKSTKITPLESEDPALQKSLFNKVADYEDKVREIKAAIAEEVILQNATSRMLNRVVPVYLQSASESSTKSAELKNRVVAIVSKFQKSNSRFLNVWEKLSKLSESDSKTGISNLHLVQFSLKPKADEIGDFVKEVTSKAATQSQTLRPDISQY